MSRIVFILIAVLLPILAPAQQYKYLVLKGGGIRGIAYVGALQVLENKKITTGIEKVAGTSVGAITGTLFSMAYTLPPSTMANGSSSADKKECERITDGIKATSWSNG